MIPTRECTCQLGPRLIYDISICTDPSGTEQKTHQPFRWDSFQMGCKNLPLAVSARRHCWGEYIFISSTSSHEKLLRSKPTSYHQLIDLQKPASSRSMACPAPSSVNGCNCPTTPPKFILWTASAWGCSPSTMNTWICMAHEEIISEISWDDNSIATGSFLCFFFLPR